MNEALVRADWAEEQGDEQTAILWRLAAAGSVALPVAAACEAVGGDPEL